MAARLVKRAARHSFHGDGGTFDASPIVTRGSTRWLAIARLVRPLHAQLVIYRWASDRWSRFGRSTRLSTGFLNVGDGIQAASLTGSTDPDFVVGSNGADNTYLDVVSDIGGRWHGVPFEYGYGRSVLIDAQGVHGHVVETATNACGCASGPESYGWEKFHGGIFRPTQPPGAVAPCTAGHLTHVADPTEALNIHFTRAHCFSGWALAVGTGGGFADEAVGLFEQHGARWRLTTLDDGAGLGLDPGIYDLPADLVHRLASGLGPGVAASGAATSVWHRFTPHDVRQGLVALSGVMTAGDGSQWMLSEAQPASPLTIGVYRWSGVNWEQLGLLRDIRTRGSIVGLPGWYRILNCPDSGTPSFVVRGETPRWTATVSLTGNGWAAIPAVAACR